MLYFCGFIFYASKKHTFSFLIRIINENREQIWSQNRISQSCLIHPSILTVKQSQQAFVEMLIHPILCHQLTIFAIL